MHTTVAITNPGKTFRPSDTDDALGWLAHGADLARDLRGDKARHHDAIWELLVEAIAIIDRQPDRERGFLTSGRRSNWKLPTGLTHREVSALERNRILSSMLPHDGQATTYGLQRDDTQRALSIMDWLRWCHAKSGDRRLVKAAVALARGGDSEVVHRIYAPNRKPHRQTIHEVRMLTTGRILAGLKKNLGIVPGHGTTFRTNGVPSPNLDAA